MAAFSIFNAVPKPPATNTLSTFSAGIPAVCSNTSIPTRIAAFAICTCLMSSCVKTIPFATGNPSFWYCSGRVPFSSIILYFHNSLTISRIPVPQIPIAGTPEMVVVIIRCLPKSDAFAIAPGMPGMPQRIFPPSKAGPAATDVTNNPPGVRSAISPFVPMSKNNTVFGSFASCLHRSHMPLL